MRRAYLDDDDREYVLATKRLLAQLIERSGMPIDELAFETGIPETSLRRWLSLNNSSFMNLPAARHICRVLGIEIADMLLPVGHDRKLDRALRIFLQLPPELADTFIDQLLAVAAALGKPIQLDDR
ncbi:helix-turn-helix domain-containing protein [Aeromonas hydrophila]|nr:helix-turn-helix domain-containing protein [Aeromonas hydrophila]